MVLCRTASPCGSRQYLILCQLALLCKLQEIFIGSRSYSLAKSEKLMPLKVETHHFAFNKSNYQIHYEIFISKSAHINSADLTSNSRPRFFICKKVNRYEKFNDKNLHPVSYTHLTLPTNREV